MSFLNSNNVRRPKMVDVEDLDAKGIAERIMKLRVDNDLSRYKLAKLLNVTESSIGAWERCEFVPSTYVIVRYARFFGVTADYILFGACSNGNT